MLIELMKNKGKKKGEPKFPQSSKTMDLCDRRVPRTLSSAIIHGTPRGKYRGGYSCDAP